MANFLIIGAGGVGSWFLFHLAPLLASESCVVIVDDDEIRPENLSRIPVPIAYFYKKEYSNIRKKAVLLATWLSSIMPSIQAVPITKRVESMAELEYLVRKYLIDVIVDAVDDSRTIEMIHKFAAEHESLHLVSIHYDGWHITARHCSGWTCTIWFSGVHQRGYRIVESSSLNASIVAWLGLMMLIDNTYGTVIIENIRRIPEALMKVKI